MMSDKLSKEEFKVIKEKTIIAYEQDFGMRPEKVLKLISHIESLEEDIETMKLILNTDSDGIKL